jgi:hypothetical protein
MILLISSLLFRSSYSESSYRRYMKNNFAIKRTVDKMIKNQANFGQNSRMKYKQIQRQRISFTEERA